MLEKITKVVLKDAMKSSADVAKEAGPLSKEARQLRKLEKLGAVPVRDFENLQKAVKAQKIGFLAIAAVEGARIISERHKKVVLSDEDINEIADTIAGSVLGSFTAATNKTTQDEAETVDDQQPVEENTPDAPVPDNTPVSSDDEENG